MSNYSVVRYGGQLGQRLTHLINGRLCTVIDTGDKETMKEKASNLKQLLTPGEKSHYGMNYSCVKSEELREVNSIESKQYATSPSVDRKANVNLRKIYKG